MINKMNFDDYKNKLPHPKTVSKKVFMCPKCNMRCSSSFCGNCGFHVQPDWNDCINEYKELSGEYQRESSRLHELFKQDALKDVGLIADRYQATWDSDTHPKADKIFNMAWDMGHSSGYYAVYDHIDNIVDTLFDDEIC